MYKSRPHRDFCGQRFGLWTVLGDRKICRTPGGGHSATWLCRCQCGTTRQVHLSSLRNGSSTGCRKCSDKRNGLAKATASGFVDGVPRITNTYWYRIIQGARSRGRDITITKDFALDLFNEQGGRCALTGWVISLPTRARGSGTASLDRRDNSLGYVPGNVQWTHWHANRMKGAFDQADFISVCAAVAQYSEQPVQFILGETKAPKVSERLAPYGESA